MSEIKPELESAIKTTLSKWCNELRELRSQRNFCQKHSFNLEAKALDQLICLLDDKIMDLEMATKINRS